MQGIPTGFVLSQLLEDAVNTDIMYIISKLHIYITYSAEWRND
jgi:hypothetical protein